MRNYIFDFDGTLADSKKCSVLATQEAFKEFGLDVPSSEQIEHFMGIPIEVSFKEMTDYKFTEESFESLLQIFREKYKAFENDTLTVFPNVPEVLNNLKSKGKQLFVVSSKKTNVLLRNLETLKINTYFKDIIGSDNVTNYKPHPEGILKLVKLHHLKKEETVMIGDAIFDLQMAHAAGVASCGVTWGSHKKEKLVKEQPKFLIHEVKQLLVLEECMLNEYSK
ncbi:HAD family hydrolase [Caldifermentibacillus hisashii]|uniref:HAD family hydrolase n=1 Tax=Bacillaceae TaxID=186817 RepID=UPI0017AA4D65|nr:HAD family hydrolase [Caldibacillus thermoamylovorans]MCM3477870.1 HAD family hydrolase [Caldibacillus thermoamylovorans]NWN96509.1 HAD family hydrolase [Bacillus sp. (in: firmicutes)]